MYDEERTIALSHDAKAKIHLVHLGFQHPRNCISKPRYLSRMNFIVNKEEKRRSFNPFTPVRETNFGKKRSSRSQKSRKYRKFDMGHFAPSTAVSPWPTTTTTMVNLSVPNKLPSTLNVRTVPKPSASSQLSKTWQRPYTSVPLSSLVHSDWSSEEDWDGTKQKERERETRQNQ